jgi:hypothetical protein
MLDLLECYKSTADSAAAPCSKTPTRRPTETALPKIWCLQVYKKTDGASLIGSTAYRNCGAGHKDVDPLHTAVCRISSDKENGAVVVVAAGKQLLKMRSSSSICSSQDNSGGGGGGGGGGDGTRRACEVEVAAMAAAAAVMMAAPQTAAGTAAAQHSLPAACPVCSLSSSCACHAVVASSP